MYKFILNQWVLRKYDSDQVFACVAKNYITLKQASVILDTPQITI